MDENITKLGPYQLNKVYNEECKQALKNMPDNCVDIAVTSPPYWGQRGDDGIGLEEDPREYIDNLIEILEQVMRVIKPEGLLWLNIGDAYNTPINWSKKDYIYSTLGADGLGFDENNSAYTKNRGNRRAYIDKKEKWLQYGNLLALPYRIITKLCDNGTLFRGEVIWYKRKPMPEGRTRRPHRKHESIYILANSEKHWFRTKPPVPSVWDLKQNSNETPHTSTFPIELPKNCIDSMGLETGIVLDPFMGSGTVGLCAKIMGFNYIGFDISESNVSIANERIETAVWTQPLPLS